MCKIIVMIFFKKIYFLFFLSFLLITTQASTEVVNKIKSKGNSRVSLETIVIFGDVILGKDYDSQEINLLIKKLYETNFFENISVELENNTLTITVQENPTINTIIFKGENAKKYKENIKSLLLLKEKSPFVNSNIKTDINLIKSFYREIGFYFVNIDAEIEVLGNNRVNLVFSIDKGEKAKIAKIFFLGDKKIRDKRLRDIITSQESQIWKFLSRNVYLNQGRVELDKRLLKNYYKNKGYYEVEVASSNVEYSEGDGFILTFNIEAGKRYRFKKISANISDALDKVAFASLEKNFNKVVGDYYSQQKLTSILEEIDKLSQLKELQFINHNVTETLDDEGVEVVINIFEGQKFSIERINVVGNSVTNDSVIRGELLVDEGDPYSALLVNKSINRLKARNIFGEITSSVSEGSTPNYKILELSIEEKATGEIAAGAGIGTDGTSFMFSVTENNWLGRGIQLSTEANISQEKVSGNIAVNNPNYNFSGNSVYSAFDLSSTDLEETSGYKSSKTGFSVGTQFEQYVDILFSPSVSLSYEDIEVKSTSSSAIQKMKGNFTNMDFLYGITLDKRNQKFQPTDGSRFKFIQSLPLVQDSSSILNGIDISSYHSVSDDLIGSAKIYLRAINGIDEDVRLTSRMFLPQTKLRGFNTRKVGPKDGKDYIGGNYTSAFGLEAQLPNLLPESTKTDVSLFMDAGNVWEVDYSDSVDNSNKIRSSIGIAANVYTTVGPLSFTLAQNITKAATDETQTFNFRLGTSF
ncbi:MAG: outer membrane protein insertion porin family [Pelagibacterales bacterium]|nr:outer membrane protein insertion porin family [Pelagibacterales bacterium]